MQSKDAMSPSPTEGTSGSTSGKSRLGGLKGIVQTIALAGVVFLLITTSFQNFQVEGISMTPNVQDGQFIIVNKAAYRRIDLSGWGDWIPFLDHNHDGYFTPFGSPKRGEVVVFSLDRQPGRNFIKRIIGLPGETIEIRRGAVIINGEPVKEPYLPLLDNRNIAPLVIPEDHYFVMGDARVNSQDSRAFGPIRRDEIIGKAWISYYPFSEFGTVDSRTPEFSQE